MTCAVPWSVVKYEMHSIAYVSETRNKCHHPLLAVSGEQIKDAGILKMNGGTDYRNREEEIKEGRMKRRKTNVKKGNN